MVPDVPRRISVRRGRCFHQIMGHFGDMPLKNPDPGLCARSVSDEPKYRSTPYTMLIGNEGADAFRNKWQQHGIHALRLTKLWSGQKTDEKKL